MKLPLPQNQFFRQLLGAVCGALIAFVLYGVYEVVSPRLTALLPSPAETSGEKGMREREERTDSIVLRARQALGQRGY